MADGRYIITNSGDYAVGTQSNDTVLKLIAVKIISIFIPAAKTLQLMPVRTMIKLMLAGQIAQLSTQETATILFITLVKAVLKFLSVAAMVTIQWV